MADGFVELTVEKLQTPQGVLELNRMLRSLFELVAGDGDKVKVYHGYGSPEDVVTAKVGSMYMRKDGGANTSVYVKETGTGATGWTAK